MFPVHDVVVLFSEWCEFCPKQVLCVRRFEEENEAVEAANSSDFGLAAAVMSSDQARWVPTIRYN